MISGLVSIHISAGYIGLKVETLEQRAMTEIYIISYITRCVQPAIMFYAANRNHDCEKGK